MIGVQQNVPDEERGITLDANLRDKEYRAQVAMEGIKVKQINK